MKRGGYRFFWECFKAKIDVRGDLGQANFKNFRRFAPQNLKFVLQKDSELRRLKEENEEYMVDNEKEYMEEGLIQVKTERAMQTNMKTGGGE